MKAIFSTDGNVVKYTPAAAVTAGDVVVIGARALVAKLDIEADRRGELDTTGVFKFRKKTGAIADGARVYWDATGDPVGGTAGTGAATTVPTAVFAGFAVGAAASGDERVGVSLSDASALDLVRAIADPGASGAIPVTQSGYVPIVSAGAETRTIAAPTFVGQSLLLLFVTDGGDCTITVAGNVNQTGNNTIVLNDAGDAIQLVAKLSGATKKWTVAFNDGATLSTV